MLLDDVVQALDVDGGRPGWCGGGGFDQRQQVARLDDGALGERGGLRDDAFQLAQIVWPEALLQLGQGGLGEQLGGLAGLVGDPAQQPRGQDGNVLDALAQRRDEDFDRGEARVEVLAELADGGENAQVAIGGGENSGVNPCRLAAAELACGGPAVGRCGAPRRRG